MLFAVLETTDVDNGPVTQTLTHSDAGRIAASAERAALMALFYRAEFTGGTRLKGPQPKVVVDRVLVIRAAAATPLHDRFVFLESSLLRSRSSSAACCY